ncbi:insecticidal toxin [Rickettsiella massiliensis]|uniref:insecticidal toxin n=1 Tax=Rickettsiella massiliensis TaxID=676517 RepID=UPI00029A9C6C|nr:insecticidal toxin [Rickettsiella massiliensis]
MDQNTTIYSDFKQLTTATAPLYSDVLQKVAEKNKVVIGLRDPNKMGQPLLQEGYGCKGFHIKAKSSTEGPTPVL